MRGLFDPTVKSKVDSCKTMKDTGNILANWLKGDVTGKRVIPDINFRDNCYSELKILYCAHEEARQIPIEYMEMFGEDDGIEMYN